MVCNKFLFVNSILQKLKKKMPCFWKALVILSSWAAAANRRIVHLFR